MEDNQSEKWTVIACRHPFFSEANYISHQRVIRYSPKYMRVLAYPTSKRKALRVAARITPLRNAIALPDHAADAAITLLNAAKEKEDG